MSYGTPPPSGSDPHEEHRPAPGDYGSAPPPPPPPGSQDQPSYGSTQQPPYGGQPPTYGTPPPSYGAAQTPSYGPGPTYGTNAQAHTGLIDIAGLGTAKVATIGQRFLARLIDSVVLGVIIWVIGLLAGAALAAGSAGTTTDAYGNPQPSGAMAAGIGAFFLIGFLGIVVIALYEIVLIALRGQTLGKMAMGVKVVRQENGQVPGWGPSLIRALIPAVGYVLCYVGEILVYLSPLFDNSGRMQGWHDKAANDVVISTR